MNAHVELRHRGLRAAYTLGGSTAIWIAHLVFAASFVRYTCNVDGVTWVQHVVTIGTALIAAHAGWVGYGLYREGRTDPEDAGTRRGSNHFIGLLGIIFAAVNVLLILGEGSMVTLIHPACHA